MTRLTPMLYPVEEEPIVVSKSIIDRFLQDEKDNANLLMLYTFYYYTAKWQRTNQPKATITYVSQGLHWTEDKVRRVKHKLINMRLIEDTVLRRDDNKIEGHYIKVNFIWCHPPLNPLPWSGGEGNSLSTNKETYSSDSLPNGHITVGMFDLFWKEYPRHVDQGKALTAWKRICNKSPKERPTWKEIKASILRQKKSQRWQTSTYIPHPTTWLNQSRWLDDPAEMISYDRENDSKPKVKYEGGEKWTLSKSGIYVHKDGRVLHD